MKKIIGLAELAFRHGIVYPLFRLIFRNPISDRPLELQKVRKLLILRYDRIGDMIVTSPMFRNLKKSHPALHLGVVTSELNAELIRNDPNVDAIYVLHANWWRLWKEVLRARREGYEVVLNFIFNRTTTGGLLANIIAPNGLKVGQGAEKYRFYFNRLLTLERSSVQMVETLASIIRLVFGVRWRDDDLTFELFVDDVAAGAVDRFLHRHALGRRSPVSTGTTPYLVLNSSASDPVRRLSIGQARALTSHLGRRRDVRTVLIWAPNDDEMREMAADAARSARCFVFPEEGKASLLEIASLIGGAVCVITPDTSIIHFASAMKTPVFGVFTPLLGVHEWLPYRVPYELLEAGQGQAVATIPVETLLARTEAFVTACLNTTGRGQG